MKVQRTEKIINLIYKFEETGKCTKQEKNKICKLLKEEVRIIEENNAEIDIYIHDEILDAHVEHMLTLILSSSQPLTEYIAYTYELEEYLKESTNYLKATKIALDRLVSDPETYLGVSFADLMELGSSIEPQTMKILQGHV